jgi:hypothetical protein
MGSINWIDLAQDRDLWIVFMNTTINTGGFNTMLVSS